MLRAWLQYAKELTFGNELLLAVVLNGKGIVL